MSQAETMVGAGCLKAQFWAFDVIFAVVIFTVAITILAFTWYDLNTQLSFASGNGATIAQLQDQALAGQLLSLGSPSDWQGAINLTRNASWANVSVGLAQAPLSGNVSTAKLYTLMSMANKNYQASKLALGVGYDYYIVVSSASTNITIGSNPQTNNALSVYVQRRNVVLAGAPATMEVVIWTRKLLAVS